ncbi:MAG TPA: diacylglycerol kinase [Alphaproteobacteria bacterium]|nr:diacylglycerol kinase [Alphaproteobacteria bacterium]
MKPGETGWRRLVHATGYSMAGLKAAWKNEAAFRQESVMTLVLLPAGLWLGNGGGERAVLVGSLMLVLVIEVINSSLEAVVDRVGAEHHPLAGMAKDMGSAAVFLALLNVVLVWGLIIWDRLISSHVVIVGE